MQQGSGFLGKRGAGAWRRRNRLPHARAPPARVDPRPAVCRSAQGGAFFIGFTSVFPVPAALDPASGLPHWLATLACRIAVGELTVQFRQHLPPPGPFPLRHAQTDRRPPRRPAKDPAGREEPEAQARRRHPFQPAQPLKQHAQVVAHDGRRERRIRASERERVRHDVRRKLRQERNLCRTGAKETPTPRRGGIFISRAERRPQSSSAPTRCRS